MSGEWSYKDTSTLSCEQKASMKMKLKIDSIESLQDFILNVYDLEDTFAKLQSAMVIQGTGLKGSKSHFNIDKEFQEDVTVLENPEERPSLPSSSSKKKKKRRRLH